MGDEFIVEVGVYQKSALSFLLFYLVMDHLTAGLQKHPSWNIFYADDIVLISDILRMLEEWRTALKNAGPRIRRRKTEYMNCSLIKSQGILSYMQDIPIHKVNNFGSFLASNGSIDTDVSHRTQGVITGVT